MVAFILSYASRKKSLTTEVTEVTGKREICSHTRKYVNLRELLHQIKTFDNFINSSIETVSARHCGDIPACDIFSSKIFLSTLLEMSHRDMVYLTGSSKEREFSIVFRLCKKADFTILKKFFSLFFLMSGFFSRFNFTTVEVTSGEG